MLRAGKGNAAVVLSLKAKADRHAKDVLPIVAKQGCSGLGLEAQRAAVGRVASLGLLSVLEQGAAEVFRLECHAFFVRGFDNGAENTQVRQLLPRFHRVGIAEWLLARFTALLRLMFVFLDLLHCQKSPLRALRDHLALVLGQAGEDVDGELVGAT